MPDSLLGSCHLGLHPSLFLQLITLGECEQAKSYLEAMLSNVSPRRILSRVLPIIFGLIMSAAILWMVWCFLLVPAAPPEELPWYFPLVFRGAIIAFFGLPCLAFCAFCAFHLYEVLALRAELKRVLRAVRISADLGCKPAQCFLVYMEEGSADGD